MDVRVVVVVSQLGYGGAERQTVALLANLKGSRSAPVGVICMSGNLEPYADVIRDLGYPLTVLRRRTGFDIRRGWALRNALRELRPDVVYAVNWLASAYAIVSCPSDCAVVSSIRNSQIPRGLVRQLLLPWLLKRSSRLIVNSESGRRLALSLCIPERLIDVVRNGVEASPVIGQGALKDVRERLQIPRDSPLVTYIGRNARVKNIPRLFATIEAVLRRRPNTHFILVGDGLDASIRRPAGLDLTSAIHCLGVRQDVSAILASSDVLLLTSDAEGTPNVVLEALVAGVPVVSTEVGDVKALIPEGAGVVVSPDPEKLAEATVAVLAGAENFRRVLADQRIDLCSRFSITAMAHNTADVWRHAALESRAGQRGHCPEP